MFHRAYKPIGKRYLRLFQCSIVISVFLSCNVFGPRAIAADQPEYVTSFDPAKGFKPAQTDLTEIFLQIAGSLECYGSPVPYLRHMKAEHTRIEAKYQARFGKPPTSYRPAYMTDEFMDKFAANWSILSAKLGLESTVKDIGGLMRDAILGTRRTGTTIVEIFNQHQKQVFDSMAGKPSEGADFDALKAQLITQLELDRTNVDEGKYEVARRDAVRSTVIIRGVVLTLFAKLDKNLKPADAAKIKAALTSVFIDVGRMAQSELEVGISEWALQHSQAASK